MPEAYRRLIKAADLISALNHCQRETHMGNREFTEALLDAYPDMAVMERCQPSYSASLDRQLTDAVLDELASFGWHKKARHLSGDYLA